MTFIAGAFTLTYNGNALGRTEDGFYHEFVHQSDMISGDNLAAIQQDGVYRGVDNEMVEGVLLEDDLALASGLLWLLNATFGRIYSSGGQSTVGYLLSALGAAFVATKIAGPNATPTTFTAASAIIAPVGFGIRRQYANRLRRISFRIQFLPSVVSSNGVFHTETT